MSTIKDVARDAGVSIATVSCCLSGSRNVKAETKMKIMDSIEKLKYIPNASARNLKKSATNNIGIVLTDIAETYHAEIFKGISFCLQKNGYTTNVGFSNNSAYMECKIIEEFISQNVAGLLIITSMPENRAFFQNCVVSHHIPSVFIERRPKDMNASFIGFDNEITVSHLTKQLLDRHYRKIALITGPGSYTSESDSIQGYQNAFEEYHIPLDPSLMQETNMSREDSFHSILANLDLDSLEAIITTSENIAYGVLEALKVQNISVSGEILLITLGEESWTEASHITGMLHTSRTAFTLGKSAAQMLLSEMQAPSLKEQNIYLEDHILKAPLILPPPAAKISFPLNKNTCADPLRILMADLSTSRAAKLLAVNFTQSTGIPVEIDLIPHSQLLKSILNDTARANHHYDIFMYDVVWQAYMGQNNLVSDISDYIIAGSFPKETVFSQNLENGRYNNKYYGVPFISGSQMMFYRNDLFENHAIAREYKKRYRFSLCPPKTWTEFNHVAEFFTRSYNPDSPTTYGTSLAGIIDEELAPEILIRLWACGGALWDSYNRASLNTPESINAFQSLLETASYVETSPLKTSIRKTVSDFSAGKTAMLITYSEYAAEVSKSMYQNIIGQVGYSLLPGRTAVSIGWYLGLNPCTSKQSEAYRYFDWLCQSNNSYYMTIMGGQSPVMAPYHSHELLKLYPWLELTESSFSCCRKRVGPSSSNALIIPQNRIEQILCSAFKDILNGDLSLENSLKKWQLELEDLFKSYGYPKPLHFLESGTTSAGCPP